MHILNSRSLSSLWVKGLPPGDSYGHPGAPFRGQRQGLFLLDLFHHLVRPASPLVQEGDVVEAQGAFVVGIQGLSKGAQKELKKLSRGALKANFAGPPKP